MLARVVREPLFHFLAAGAALFAAYALLEARRNEPVRLAAATRAALIADFEAITGGPAGAEDVARLEREFVTDELLYRDALAAELHLSDGAVRRQLIDRMRQRITDGLREPGEEDLVNFYAENLRLYETEPAASFEQVFFAAQPPDPAALAAKLRAGSEASGDPARFGAEFPRYGISMLRGLFGPKFVTALWEAPLGEWSGPIRSIQGWHFVLPTERLAPAQLSFQAAHDQVARDYLAARAREAVDRRVAELEGRYEVVIERR
ncbi:MAG: peptidyl-prolyl cis-trans isomerase [Gammaproteobacteria bacterium]|nr:peptidyl-prolyl cis-trans isomerase [Gammaproteobacteria bacterium]